MGKGFKPDCWRDSIYQIDWDALRRQGIKGLLFDIDNTLEPYASPEPSGKLMELLDRLRETGFQTGILSNAKEGRAKRFAEKAQIRFVGHAGKPLRRGYRQMAQQMKLKPEETAMIGDQLFTDIWGANRFGSFSILVTPIDYKKEPWFVACKRLAEKPFLARYRKIKEKSDHDG